MEKEQVTGKVDEVKGKTKQAVAVLAVTLSFTMKALPRKERARSSRPTEI